MIKDLPSALRIELAVVLNEKYLLRVKMFQVASSRSIAMLALALKQRACMPNELIVSEDYFNDRLYLVRSGLLHVFVKAASFKHPPAQNGGGHTHHGVKRLPSRRASVKRTASASVLSSGAVPVVPGKGSATILSSGAVPVVPGKGSATILSSGAVPVVPGKGSATILSSGAVPVVPGKGSEPRRSTSEQRRPRSASCLVSSSAARDMGLPAPEHSTPIAGQGSKADSTETRTQPHPLYSFYKPYPHPHPHTQPHLSPLTSHLSPLTSHLPAPTSHLSPLTSHLSPLTSHLSPLTSHPSSVPSHSPTPTPTPSPSPSPSPSRAGPYLPHFLPYYI